MKTLIVTISLMLLTLTFTSANASTRKPRDINKILQKEISYPDFAKTQKLEGTVLVSLTVNTDGTIKVNLTNDSNATLKDYVVSKLQSLKIIPSSENAGKSYDVRFEFKLEK
jgi:outer membrane biosynthesis protein TonB